MEINGEGTLSSIQVLKLLCILGHIPDTTVPAEKAATLTATPEQHHGSKQTIIEVLGARLLTNQLFAGPEETLHIGLIRRKNDYPV